MRHVKGAEGKERDLKGLKSLCVCHQTGVSDARGKGNGSRCLRQGVLEEEGSGLLVPYHVTIRLQ